MGKGYIGLGLFLAALGILVLTNVIDLIAWLTPSDSHCIGNECDAGRSGIWVVGAVFVLMGLGFAGLGWFFRNADREDRRIRKTGIRGTAIIRAVHRSSMSVDDEPVANLELDVEAAGVRFSAKCSPVVPLIFLSRVVPGASLPVIVDPKDQTNLIIDWDSPAITDAT